ncbi:hypothetical protein [Ancylobacter vacuolatus]|uniref:hypothetical protein n=1 Tax=Ancylobacter vacuolatus TaxID=223389 RepID=UPI0027D8A9B9|nr:hypothetical protein [Ancylobacter vacuolatus]
MITEQSDEDEAPKRPPSDRSVTDGSPDDPILDRLGSRRASLSHALGKAKAEAAGEPAASNDQMIT